MKFARARVREPDGPTTRLLVAGNDDHTWFDLRTATRIHAERNGASLESAKRYAAVLVPPDLAQALAGGTLFSDAVARTLDERPEEAIATNPALVNALDPISYRDFMVFEGHFSFGYQWQGKPVPDVLYDMPLSYAGDPLSFLGPDDVIPWPAYTKHLDYELELGIVIGRVGTNLTPDTALDHVLGLTILNDVSARDIQVREMAGGLGPSKGKHFACVTGPLITTLDEIDESGLRMCVRVNGETWCDTTSANMTWSVAEIVAWASQGETLHPGALLGTGTCNGGSAVEVNRTLTPGDLIEFEVDQLGTLRNRLGSPQAGGWRPTARNRDSCGRATEARFLY